MNLVRQMRDAIDCQNTQLFGEVIWPDGHLVSSDGNRTRFADARLNGPCPKYRTYLREIRVLGASANRETVRLKSIATRVAFDGRYSGDYTVAKMEYVCERRKGRWAILSQSWLTRQDFLNQNAAAEFRRSGGYDSDPETEL